MQKTLDCIPQMIWTMEADESGEYYNKRWVEFTGTAVGAETGTRRIDLVHPDDRVAALARWELSATTGDLYEATYRLLHRSGQYRWVLSRAEAERDEAGAVVRWYGSVTPIHDQVVASEALQKSEALTRTIIAASPDCISLLDAQGKVLFLNQASLNAIGVEDLNTVVGRPWLDTFPQSVRGPARLALNQALRGRTSHFTAAQRSASSALWWDVVVAPVNAPSDRPTSLLAIARDITHQKSAEERAQWSANHDALTGLANRTLFQRILDQYLQEAASTDSNLTVLILDLDDFKRTNDALGHDAGDALLKTFADRIRTSLRADDLVARLGGDEFAIVLRGVGEDHEIKAATDAIFTSLKEPCVVDGKLLDIRASIGASAYPRGGRSRADLLKNADLALYVAKNAGRGVLRVFSSGMRADAQTRLSSLSVAKDALADHRVIPFYQPKIDLRSKRLNGFEALLRWRDFRGGIHSPAAISAVFDDLTLAAEISERMIGSVISDMRRWIDAGVDFKHVAINAAAAEFRRSDFAESLLMRLEAASISPTLLQVEVTETVFVGRGGEYVERALKKLSSSGVKIVLDDFGTGYASLSHLKHFPVDVLKIDRSFVEKLDEDSDDAAIVRAVIRLGRSLGIEVVAEGIETSSQAAYLSRQRCHTGQGFLFGKAEPAEAVAKIVRTWASRQTEVTQP